MIRNYFKTTLRNLIKHKGYSFINISGLAVGIACCLLIILYVKDELSFDRFHDNTENIYRMQSTITMNDNKQVFNAVGLPAGPTLLDEVPSITNQTRYLSRAMEVRIGDKEYTEGGALYVEPAFLEIFNFPSKQGNAQSALANPNEISLTEEASEKYFGKKEAVGESLEIKVNNDWKTFTVGAIMRNVPSNSTLDFNMLLPFESYLMANGRQSNDTNDWSRIELSFQTFVVTAPNQQLDSLTSTINEIRQSRMSGTIAEILKFELQPMNQVHWDGTISNGVGMREGSNKIYSILLGGIAFVILMLACINFTNLSVARSLPRANEIGVRKVVGALRKQLVSQFLSEALFVSFVSFVLGLIIAQLVLPVFETVTEKEFSASIIDDPVYVFMALIVVILAAFVAGIYPALMISRFNTVSALKGSAGNVGGKNWLQKSLVVLQFTIAAFLIIGVLTMNRQISYMVNKDKGYNDQNLLGIALNYSERPNAEGEIPGEGERMMNLLKNELAQTPSIEYVTGKSPGLRMTMTVTVNEETGEREQVRTFTERVDPDFFKALGMDIVDGRDFELTNGESERDYMIVNEEFARKMDWGDSVVGRSFSAGGSSAQIIGLVKDYNFQSLESAIDPMTISLSKNIAIGEVLIKFKEGTLTESLAAIEAAWLKFNDVVPFEHFLLEERNADQYGDQARWKSILVVASLIAIAISCLGLFGLAYMAMQRRTKEIGVRKVLGAPIPTIVFILSRGFTSLVFISILIACPLAYFGGEEWLSKFPYRIEMGWDMFLVAGVVTLLVAFLTVSFHSIKTAFSNPVKALRYE